MEWSENWSGFWSGFWSEIWSGSLIFFVVSSPEPSGSQGELIVYPWSVVRRRPSSSVHIFQTSSPQKPLGRSKPNFMWSLLGKGERKFI